MVVLNGLRRIRFLSNFYIHFQLNFELIDLVSVSNVWEARPIENKKSMRPLVFTRSNNNKIDDLASVVLKASPSECNSSEAKNKIFYNQKMFRSTERDDIDQRNKPDELVLFEFIKSDLRKHFLSNFNQAEFLNVYLVWRSIVRIDEDKILVNYGLMPNKVVSAQSPTSLQAQQTTQVIQSQQQLPQQRSASTNTFLDIASPVANNGNLKNLLLMVARCESRVSFDFARNNLCPVLVQIEMKNLSSSQSFDLIMIVKNPR